MGAKVVPGHRARPFSRDQGFNQSGHQHRFIVITVIIPAADPRAGRACRQVTQSRAEDDPSKSEQVLVIENPVSRPCPLVACRPSHQFPLFLSSFCLWERVFPDNDSGALSPLEIHHGIRKGGGEMIERSRAAGTAPAPARYAPRPVQVIRRRNMDGNRCPVLSWRVPASAEPVIERRVRSTVQVDEWVVCRAGFGGGDRESWPALSTCPWAKADFARVISAVRSGARLPLINVDALRF